VSVPRLSALATNASAASVSCQEYWRMVVFILVPSQQRGGGQGRLARVNVPAAPLYSAGRA
jgi:hypothetical protein